MKLSAILPARPGVKPISVPASLNARNRPSGSDNHPRNSSKAAIVAAQFPAAQIGQRADAPPFGIGGIQRQRNHRNRLAVIAPIGPVPADRQQGEQQYRQLGGALRIAPSYHS